MQSSVTLLQPYVRAVCMELDTPKALAVYLCVKHDASALGQLKIDPRDYLDNVSGVRSFAKDYAAYSFVRKYEGLPTGINTAEAARSGWLLSEERCGDTNRRLRSSSLGWEADVLSVMLQAKRKIESLLTYDVDLCTVLDSSRWGNGATATLRRGSFVDQKMSPKISVTRLCVPLLATVIASDPLWTEHLIGVRPDGPCVVWPSPFEIIEGNIHDVVPKDAFKDRNIGKEPTGNGFLQQGVHDFLRKQLKSVGIDLSDQSRNQELARVARGLGLATVDLSNASDTISLELVRFLLPEPWFDLLDRLRSQKTLFEGNWRRLEKFSSMGNAFTFELETLIFWALSTATCDAVGVRGPVSVYGDDIVVPAGCEVLLRKVFDFVGFEINVEKSFFSGNFFESCGKHYFAGVDVTPFYQKEGLEDDSAIVRAYNRIMRFCYRTSGSRTGWPLRKAAKLLVKSYSGDVLPRVPFFSQRDDGFISNLGTTSPGVHRCNVIANRGVSLPMDPLPNLAYKLRLVAQHAAVDSNDDNDGEVVPHLYSPHPDGRDDYSRDVPPDRFTPELRRVYIYSPPVLSYEDDWVLR